MAFVKCVNKDGDEAEFHYEIYDQDDERFTSNSSTFSYDAGGLINQRMVIDLVLGKLTYSYPISFKNRVNSVMITDNDIDNRTVYITDFDLNKFTIEVLVTAPKRKINILATGY